MLQTCNLWSHPIHTYHCLICLLSHSLAVSPYIIKLKFGNYAMLNVLADQWKAPRGHVRPKTLDRWKSVQGQDLPAPNDREGGGQDLRAGWTTSQVVVMHDFIWALVEEQVSDRAHQHQVKNWDSRQDICQVESEAHSISQDIIAQALHPGRPMVCDYIGTRSLTVDMLWEVVYGVFREALCLESLEDFNASEVDLGEMKDKILSSGRPRISARLHPLGPPLSHHLQGLARRRSPPWVLPSCPPVPQCLHPSARVLSLDWAML